MASVIDLCNKALDKLGQGAITSLSDNTKSARICDRNWPLVRDQVLRDHPWNFAVKRAVLASSETAPAWGFSAQFPLPSDCLRLIEVRDLSTGEYQVEDGHIHANATVPYTRPLKRAPGPPVCAGLCVDTAATRLAAEMCEAFTQSTQKKQALFEEYSDSITRAKRVDAQENPPVGFEEDEWVLARY